jgi:hypothetical protein
LFVVVVIVRRRRCSSSSSLFVVVIVVRRRHRCSSSLLFVFAVQHLAWPLCSQDCSLMFEALCSRGCNRGSSTRWGDGLDQCCGCGVMLGMRPKIMRCPEAARPKQVWHWHSPGERARQETNQPERARLETGPLTAGE